MAAPVTDKRESTPRSLQMIKRENSEVCILRYCIRVHLGLHIFGGEPVRLYERQEEIVIFET